ncbi:hypothetical protein [Gynurincola endophyticus]|uniref:hypothetical protein n=1 Tax=Gynurincola endophyticus TaxID=2479004 RepID=UPI000F8C76BF|nr:hypothetical protein [Gynurincola endophyticus]
MNKRLLITTVAMGVIASCQNRSSTTDDSTKIHILSNELTPKVQGEQLKNYFVPGSIEITDRYLVEVIQTQSAFDSYLHPAATMGSVFRKIDFENEWVLLVAGKPSGHRTTFTVKKAEQEGGVLQVQLSENVSVDVDSFVSSSLLVYTFPREGVSKIMVAINGYTTEKIVN